MDSEEYFISLFSKKCAVIGDDAALVGNTAYSKDAFFENIHYRRKWLSLEQIGYKAMMVNISDAVAMNADPRYAMLAVAMPSDFSASEMRQLSRGFQRAAEEFGVAIIGGDTIANTKLDITVSIVSHTDRPLLRTGLKHGHMLAYTGRIGRSAKELRYLLAGGRIHSRSKFVTFSLRREFVAKCTRFLSCGMDLSDGLCSDLGKLGRLNRCGFDFIRPIEKRAACSGEEYEMLVGFSPRERKRIVRHAQKLRVPFTVVAKAVRGRYANRCKAHHF